MTLKVTVVGYSSGVLENKRYKNINILMMKCKGSVKNAGKWWIAHSGLVAAPSEGVNVLIPSDRKMSGQVKPEGKALDFPVGLHCNPQLQS